MEFYYQFLSGKAQQTYRCIEQGIKNQRKNILLLGCFSEPYATELVKLVSYDHPELFYVNYSKLSYLQGTLGFTYQPDYVFPLTQIKRLECTLQIQAEKILEEIAPEPDSAAVSANMKALHDFLEQKLDVRGARLAPELIEQFVEVVTPISDYTYRWKLNTGSKKEKHERADLMAVTGKPVLTFTIDFETAKKYREANKMPHQFRRAAWSDLTVEVYL